MYNQSRRSHTVSRWIPILPRFVIYSLSVFSPKWWQQTYYTIPDNFCANPKNIPDKASTVTQER